MEIEDNNMFLLTLGLQLTIISIIDSSVDYFCEFTSGVLNTSIAATYQSIAA